MFIKKFTYRLLVTLVFFSFSNYSKGQATMQDAPIFGAEIFIEPGQTPLEIDTWFSRLKESGMKVTRIRLFEYYMHKPDGTWDYSLFDLAFKAGEKYGIKIYGNIFPNNENGGLEKFHFPATDKHQVAISDYIMHCVAHFKKFTSLYGWVPMNEPGANAITNDQFTQTKFEEWKKVQPTHTYNSSGYNSFRFEEERFLVYFDTWWLQWLTNEIKKNDNAHLIHINNHDIFRNVAEYNFPEWRKFINSLGGSAHASWHFGYFPPEKYTYAMSANSEILRSGAGPIPWLMTEIQGGNNTYSSKYPMCPTVDEIIQWLWIIQGSGSKGSIFWCLNPRGSNVEAGEWAMLDFQNGPSDRLTAASKVIAEIDRDSMLFKKAVVCESGINILYIREAMWVEKKILNQESQVPYEGRTNGAVMKSALSYFEALSELGIQSNLKEIEEFDFTNASYKGTTIILPHQVSVPSKNWPQLAHFVSKGGNLIVDGLTAFYDENAHCILIGGFPLKQLFGGEIKEYKVVSNIFPLNLYNNQNLPAHIWKGTIQPATGKSIATIDNETVAIKNTYGEGEVLWVPELIGLASRITGSYQKFCSFLLNEMQPLVKNIPVRFKNHQPGMLLKLLKSGNSYVAVICNTSKAARTVPLLVKQELKSPVIIFKGKAAVLNANTLTIAAGETVVIKYN